MIYVVMPNDPDDESDYREYSFTNDPLIIRKYEELYEGSYKCIRSMTEEQFEAFKKRILNCEDVDAAFEELYEVEKGVVMTEAAYQFVVDGLFEDIETLYVDLVKIQKSLGCFKGKDFSTFKANLNTVIKDMEKMSTSTVDEGWLKRKKAIRRLLKYGTIF